MPHEITPKQAAVLDLLAEARTPLSAYNIVNRLSLPTEQGATQTAASLVRRGYVWKSYDARRRVHYSITPSGREILAAGRSFTSLSSLLP